MSEENLKHTDLLALYNKAIEDIRFTKNQIWNTLYLTILGMSGIIGLTVYLEDAEITISRYKTWAAVIIVVLFIFGLVTFIFHQLSLNQFRKMKIYYHNLLSQKHLISKDNALRKCNICFFILINPVLMISATMFALYIVCTL
jgi:hypothetical protein